MSGIAGIINDRSEHDSLEILNAMCGIMAHRGPDGYRVFNAPGVLLGHRRLTIGDPEHEGALCFAEDDDILLVMDGTICNAAQLRNELKDKGQLCTAPSEAQLLIRLYRELGTGFVSKLSGPFAFALYDRSKNKLFLGRDLFGKRPLYYFIRHGMLVFGSGLEVLKCHPDFPDRMDPEALADYFSLLYVPQPRTVYREVSALAPGHVISFDCASGHTETVFRMQLDFSRKLPGTREELAEELRRLVIRAVEKRLTANVPVGVFLSGGIDSNIVAAVTAQLLQGKSFPAFTVGFSENRYDERSLARLGAAAINARCGGALQHQEREIDIPDFSLVEELTSHCGQPYADSSVLPTALLSGFARQEVPVALSGDGADELFGGYERYIAMEMARKADKIPHVLRRSLFQLISLFPDHGERSFSGRLRRFLRISCAGEEERYFAVIDRCLPALRKKLFSGDFYASLNTSGAERFRRSAGELSTLTPAEVFSETDIRTYLPGDTLPKADIASMFAGLDVRSPFLDREVAEFAAALPWEMKLAGKERKSILKYAFRDLLAPEIFNAPKKGFGVPVAALLRDKWRTNAAEVLFEGELRNGEFLDPACVQKLWLEHQSGHLDHSYILWEIIVFGLFLRNSRH